MNEALWKGITITRKSEKLNKQNAVLLTSEIANPRICGKLAGRKKKNK